MATNIRLIDLGDTSDEKYIAAEKIRIMNLQEFIDYLNTVISGGGGIALPVSSDDVSYNSSTQTYFNQTISSDLEQYANVILENSNKIVQITGNDGSGGELIYVSVPGYPIMTLEQATTLIASRLKVKVNIADNYMRNLNDVGIIRGGEVLIKDPTTLVITSLALLIKGQAGISGSGILLKHQDAPNTLIRDVEHQIVFLGSVGTSSDGSYFSKNGDGLQVDDPSRFRELLVHVNLFTNSSFVYNVELKDQNNNVIASKEITTVGNDTTDDTFGVNYVSDNDVDTYRLFITEIDGEGQSGYVVIGKTTSITANVYDSGKYVIDPQYIPQQTYVEMEDSTNSFTLTEIEQLIYTVNPLNIGQSTVMPRNFNLRFEYTRTGSGIASVSSYLNVIIKQGGVTIYNGSISTQQTGANSHSAVFTNVIKHDYDANSTLEIFMSYDDGAGATAPGTLNLNNILGSIVVDPVV